ncbi:uncharacterized protein LOC103577721 [Microplitis demolitor]|uniref:uncharacterized protein LOC103577721 n=1 Tax=Microplitis demolitor TaxID=69319 RepID=UPI0004CCE766|nr:uncharacterized protein LOC103577721 [Microplitis demolitor]XP_014299163.1 uncharacterized protein LOC103577721 [Microplitis demolitor]
MIRQRMRMIGRFLQAVKEIDPEIKNLSNLLIPGNYRLCMDGIKKLAGMSDDGTEFKAPSTATALGTLLKNICEFLIRVYIERQDHKKKNETEDLLKLFNGGFEIINRRATETLVKRKRLKKVTLPNQSDIEKLTNYLERKRQRAYNKLQKKFKHKYWLLLSETTLLLVQVFNRRRQGEASKTLIEDYEGFKSFHDEKNKDYYDSLSDSEKKIADTYIRIEVRGKLRRTVAMLISPEIRESFETIINFRETAGVPKNNPYLFGLPLLNDKRYKRLSACNLLTKYANLCKADDPATLRGTILRKHIATPIANNNLTNTEVADMADFLGHAEKVYRSHYRQKECRQIATIPQVLQAGIGKQQKKADVPSFNDSNEAEDHNLSSENESILPALSRLQIIANERSYNNRQLGILNKKFIESNERVHNKFDDSEDDEPKLKKKLCSRIAWNYIVSKSYPPKQEVEKLIAENKGIIGRRTPKQIKAWLSNQYKKATK